MRKLALFMHVSLDGYTTNSEEQMDWILVDEQMFDIAGQQAQKSDTALYGRGTYKIMESYWPTAAEKPDASKHDIEHSAWYKSVQKIVISTTLTAAEAKNAHIISHNICDEIRKLKNEKGKGIIMFGSPTLAASLMKENIIDEYFLFINPIILGEGKPLFRPFKKNIILNLIECQVLASGVVCLHYALKQ